MNNEQVIQKLMDEEQIPLPKNFGPPFIITLLRECCNYDEEKRPTFKVKEYGSKKFKIKNKPFFNFYIFFFLLGITR